MQNAHAHGLNNADPLRLRGHPAVQQREQVVAQGSDICAGGNGGDVLRARLRAPWA